MTRANWQVYIIATHTLGLLQTHSTVTHTLVDTLAGPNTHTYLISRRTNCFFSCKRSHVCRRTVETCLWAHKQCSAHTQRVTRHLSNIISFGTVCLLSVARLHPAAPLAVVQNWVILTATTHSHRHTHTHTLHL